MTGPRMRAGDADRQSAVDRLAQHFTAGRLATDEYDERVGQAYSAVYLDELPTLFADLPSPAVGSRDPGPGGYRTGRVAPQAFWSDIGSWQGRSGMRRPGPFNGPPPRVFLALAVFAVLGMIFMTISALAHGFFPVPLVVLAVFLLARRGRCRGRRQRPRLDGADHAAH